VNALKRLRSAETVAGSRNKPVDEVAADYPVAAASTQAGSSASIVASTLGSSTS
jgi:hypothetical protein